MDNESLREYTKAVQADALRAFIQEQSDDTATALPEGVEVCDLEMYLQERRRYRGSMATTLISEFVEYSRTTVDSIHLLTDGVPDQFPCFVNPEQMTAKAFFNLGDTESPGHGDFTANLKLQKTAAFQELLSINEKKFGQRELAEWMEDHVDYLEAETSGGVLLSMAQAVSAIRRITIGSNAEATSEESNFGTRRSAMAEVEAKNQDQLPAFLTFKCEPYQGLDERTFRVRLAVITGEEPRISTRIVRLETQEEEMARELEEKLRTSFEDSPVKTYVGIFCP
ncbi:DUF2303 family protein [Marinobacter sp. M1N3S26]|uniref:DUF2303 family protein n=1 Tax=Marinobacter sp. M1N3S26 TaxID=3382299 RepID=UPI00387B00C2